jgi:translocation and assembly module TamA
LRVSAVVSGAQEGILADTTFMKLRGDGRVVLSPLPNWRLLGYGSTGVILVDSIDDLPPSLRFYAGGNRSVRGYRYRSLGPTDSSGTVVGGRYLLTGSAECERRISKLWRVSAFYDAGNAMDDPTIDLAHGIGIGVGIELPFGKATLDFAYPLTDEGSSQYVFFSVGADL